MKNKQWLFPFVVTKCFWILIVHYFSNLVKNSVTLSWTLVLKVKRELMLVVLLENGTRCYLVKCSIQIMRYFCLLHLTKQHSTLTVPPGLTQSIYRFSSLLVVLLVKPFMTIASWIAISVGMSTRVF